MYYASVVSEGDQLSAYEYTTLELKGREIGRHKDASSDYFYSNV
jgi:hypothetical protein